MFTQQTPGVYFQWRDQHPSDLIPLRTDIAGFIGITERGPVQKPTKVENWIQFTTIFGGHIPQAYLAYAVEGFFANGGQMCWVVRVAKSDEDSMGSAYPAKAILKSGSRSVYLVASSPGTWGQNVLVTTRRLDANQFTLILRHQGGAQEIWRNLTLIPPEEADESELENGRYIKTMLNHQKNGSQLVTIVDKTPSSQPEPSLPLFDLTTTPSMTHWLAGGCDGLAQLRMDHFTGENAPFGQRWGLQALELVDEVSIVTMPDMMPKPMVTPNRVKRQVPCDLLDAEPLPSPPPEKKLEFPPQFASHEIHRLYDQLIHHCEKLKDRVAILDTLPEMRTPDKVFGWRSEFDTKYTAVYFPWIRVPDPLRINGLLRSIPPSGHVAGVYALGDLQIGVHKPPANQTLKGVKDVEVPVDDANHGRFNRRGINVIRPHNGRDIRIAGARTMSSDTEWRYINVRRLIIMIAETLEEQLQWTVHEPNTTELWRDVDRVVTAFLDRLWQNGVLDGASTQQAYSVRCDETTNPAFEIEQGRTICEIGIQPPWPAEFVIVHLGHTEGGLELLEE